MSKWTRWLVLPLSRVSLYTRPELKRMSQHHISGSALAPVNTKLPSGENRTCTTTSIQLNLNTLPL